MGAVTELTFSPSLVHQISFSYCLLIELGALAVDIVIRHLALHAVLPQHSEVYGGWDYLKYEGWDCAIGTSISPKFGAVKVSEFVQESVSCFSHSTA